MIPPQQQLFLPYFRKNTHIHINTQMKTMKISHKPYPFSPSLLLLLPFVLISLSSAATDSVYGTFLQCLSKNSNPLKEISSIVYNPINSSYAPTLQDYIRNRRFNESTTPKPIIIVTPLKESHVQATVICSKKMGIQLRTRSGGHDFEGCSYVSNTTFILVDMSTLQSINIDIKEETAWVQVGATIGELYYRIWEKSKVHAFPAGVCPTVGVGGHISGAGYGNLLRKYGLTVDNIADAVIVDINGRILNRSSMGEDLFWAIRGGGGASFGVILSYKIKLVQVPEIVTVFQVDRTLEGNATDIIYRWQYVADKIDNDLFIRLHVKPDKGKMSINASFAALFLGGSGKLLSVMNEGFPELGLQKEECKEMGWIESTLYWSNSGSMDVLLNRTHYSPQFAKRKSDYLQKPIPKDKLELIWKMMIDLGDTGLIFNPYGGKMSEIPDWETPFPHRAGNIFKIQYNVNWDERGLEAERYYVNQTRVLHDYMTPFVSRSPRGAYLNYRDLDIGISQNGNRSYTAGRVYGVKYFKGNFDRLVKVKTMADPDNFFRYEQSIPLLPTGRKNRRR